ncbi:MAG: hypothetical protein KGD72_09020 [Candidatus Lokiarchaeota archaeon]|nr:hypothetical protein [Candidatus Lokiarchaeota archaeon]
MPQWDRIKNERISIYFDIILGTVISIFSIFCIIFTSITQGINNFSIFYVLGLGFWIFWLGFSIFLIVIGIKSYYNEKYFELTGEHKKPRRLKAPIVS